MTLLGESFDKTAKIVGDLAIPAVPRLNHGRPEPANGERFELPRTDARDGSGRDFSFSGLKTAVRRQAQVACARQRRSPTRIAADLCASPFRPRVTRVVADRTRRAMTAYVEKLGNRAPRRLVVSGGVAANAALRDALSELSEAEHFELLAPPPSLCTDNAAMIAWAGAEHLALGRRDGFDAPARARWPLDETAPPAIGAGAKA